MKRSWKFTTTKYSSLLFCQQKISHYFTERGSVQCTLSILWIALIVKKKKRLTLYFKKNYKDKNAEWNISHKGNTVKSSLNRVIGERNYQLWIIPTSCRFKARKYDLMWIRFDIFSMNRTREIYKGVMLVYYADISLKIIARRSGKYVRLLCRSQCATRW